MSVRNGLLRRLSDLRRARWPLASPVGRMRLMLIAIAVVFSMCAGRALQVQAFDAQAYAAEAADQMQQSQVLPALRGEITDRYGDVLAYTEQTVNVIADPKAIATNGKMNLQPMTESDKAIAATAPQKIADLLAKYLGGAAADYLPKLTNDKISYKVIAKQVPAETFQELQTDMKAAGLLGLSRVTAPTRRYPNGTLAANLLGWVNEQGDAAGGLELSLEKLLHGTDGKEVYDSSPNGKIPLGDNVLVPAQNGHNFSLTIDSAMQLMAEQRLEKALANTGAEAGAVIVMDPRTGELLAMANGPSFDSNDPGEGDIENMGNRAAMNAYEPGSVQKVLTFAALLDSGTTTADTKVKVPGFIKQDQFTITDWWNHGTITLRARGVFAKSSNVGTITLAREMSKEQLHDYYTSFGLGQRTNIGIGGEATGYLPKATMADYTRDGISFGTSLSVTALQNAAAVASVVNGGVYHAPTVIATMDGQPYTATNQDTTARRVISEEASEQVRSLMEQQALNQTSSAFTINGYRIGTKTGTARQVSADCKCYRGESVVSTIGVAPIDDPQVLVYAVVWNPQYKGASGAAVAAPIMHDVLALALPRYAVAPSTTKGVKLPLR
ncbi:peptidoglycan D,D-transpeptidase FtsI family protein [Micropruina sp.]|uniref:peptidoglycan D,D-transpeptidase FtsI family protein n=1 Tax=Micropruina sp. TaxID=2737536 RepID=UPI0039E5A5AC